MFCLWILHSVFGFCDVKDFLYMEIKFLWAFLPESNFQSAPNFVFRWSLTGWSGRNSCIEFNLIRILEILKIAPWVLIKKGSIN